VGEILSDPNPYFLPLFSPPTRVVAAVRPSAAHIAALIQCLGYQATALAAEVQGSEWGPPEAL